MMTQLVMRRSLIAGLEPDYPKPKSIKITKSNSIPERGSVYDFVFEKKASGVWTEWMELVKRDSSDIPANAKVRSYLISPFLTLVFVYKCQQSRT